MFISDFAIKRPMITIVSMVALVVFGLFALWRLQTDEFPDVANPVVFTAIVYPGASPDQVERELPVQIKPAALQASGIAVSQVVQALQSQNLAVPVGRLEGSLDERTIRLR